MGPQMAGLGMRAQAHCRRWQAKAGKIAGGREARLVGRENTRMELARYRENLALNSPPESHTDTSEMSGAPVVVVVVITLLARILSVAGGCELSE